MKFQIQTLLPPRRTPRCAFTLLEILVVLAIIGLLVSLTVTAVTNASEKAQIRAANIFVNDTMKIALTTYKLDEGSYPTTEQGLQALVTPPADLAATWSGPYLEDKGNIVPLDPWKQAYVYNAPGAHNPRTYDLSSNGPDRTAATVDDIGNW